MRGLRNRKEKDEVRKPEGRDRAALPTSCYPKALYLYHSASQRMEVRDSLCHRRGGNERGNPNKMSGGLCQAFEAEFASYSQICSGNLGRDERTPEGVFQASRIHSVLLDCHLWGASRRKRLEAGDLAEPLIGGAVVSA